MKARVKATGEIGIVANIDILFGCKGYRYQSDEVEIIDSYAEVDTDADGDYWTRLEHQYAGMAMQGILSNHNLYGSVIHTTQVSRVAIDYARELIKNMKEERNG